jgi:hypothetical protein
MDEISSQVCRHCGRHIEMTGQFPTAMSSPAASLFSWCHNPGVRAINKCMKAEAPVSATQCSG